MSEESDVTSEGQQDEQVPQDAPEANDTATDTAIDTGDGTSQDSTEPRADSARDGADTSNDEPDGDKSSGVAVETVESTGPSRNVVEGGSPIDWSKLHNGPLEPSYMTPEEFNSLRGIADESVDTEPVPEPVSMPGLTGGRIVHYIEQTADGKHKAAIISDVVDPVYGTVNLVVFNPHTQRHEEPARSIYECAFDKDAMEQGTWHWIEKA